jgi:hypothetical protein
MQITEQDMRLVEGWFQRQGGYGSVADIRRATNRRTGDPVAKKMAKAGRLLWLARNSYKLPSTEVEADMAKRDVRKPKGCRKIKKGIGSY